MSKLNVVLIASLGAALSACASAAPRPSERPDLVIPPPPPHVVPINAEPIAEPVGDLPGASVPAAGSPATRSGRGSREASNRPAAAPDTKPESKPGSEVKPEAPIPEVVSAPPPPASPPPQLRTADGPAAEGAVRAQVERARNLLKNVDYRMLTAIRKKAYDDAKRFADQADEALRQGNVVFAQGVAGKAETLARELAGR